MKRLLPLLLALVLLLSACADLPALPALPQSTPDPTQAPATASPDTAEGQLQVHFIDVGQADCALLYTGDHAMLIDGGNVDDSSLVASYLLNLGIEKLDCVVATHAHEDHAGALGGILSVFPVETVFVTTLTYSSKCYDDFMHYVDQQDITPTIPQPGDIYRLGDCKITFLGPVKSYADTNDTSLVCRADFGSRSFLFTGDMETTAEADLLSSGADLKADVLKLGHHGSSTSTGYVFLREVAPMWGVISCGKDNDYGHPHREIVSRLNDAEISYYRTDTAGTVIAETDGESLVFSTERNVAPEGGDDGVEEEEIFIGNKNSKKFHSSSCDSLPSESNQVIFETYEDAIAAGYTPCGGCLG